jgi:hypothetical protein
MDHHGILQATSECQTVVSHRYYLQSVVVNNSHFVGRRSCRWIGKSRMHTLCDWLSVAGVTCYYPHLKSEPGLSFVCSVNLSGNTFISLGEQAFVRTGVRGMCTDHHRSPTACSRIRNGSLTLVYISCIIPSNGGSRYLEQYKMLFLRQILPGFLLITITMAQSAIGPTTLVVSMLGMIPECSVSTLSLH